MKPPDPSLHLAHDLRQEIKGERSEVSAQFVKLTDLSSAALATSLRYCSHARFVAFGYCHAGDDVL